MTLDPKNYGLKMPSSVSKYAGGIGGGAAKGASMGAMLGPWGALAGGLVGAVGGGIQAGEDQANLLAQLELEKRRQEEIEKQNAIANRQTDRSQNMTGIDILAKMRSEAMARHKGDMFKTDLWKVLG
jgi:outer membrane lipoprotein SlyB